MADMYRTMFQGVKVYGDVFANFKMNYNTGKSQKYKCVCCGISKEGMASSN